MNHFVPLWLCLILYSIALLILLKHISKMIRLKTSFFAKKNMNIMRYSQLLDRIKDSSNKNRISIIDFDNTTKYTTSYLELYQKSKSLATQLQSYPSITTIKSIGSLVGSNSDYVVSLLATWILGKRFVPLSTTHPLKEIDYFVKDSSIGIILYNSNDTATQSANSKEVIANIDTGLYDLANRDYSKYSNELFIGEKQDVRSQRLTEDALVLYTSGTTGQPKGVLHSHDTLQAMINDVTSSWLYNSNDHILHFLPLYHLHGVLNKLLSVLWCGGTVEFLPSAKTDVIWSRLEDSNAPKPTMFMAVPTIYAKLLESHKNNNVSENAIQIFKDMRLHVSGSAALPDVIMDEWFKLTGHVLLERYGMTELGMILSNPIEAIKRKKGTVGFPFPSILAKIIDDDGTIVTEQETPGELLVKVCFIFLFYILFKMYLLCHLLLGRYII